MESQWNGTLSVSVGETWLSSGELASLKPGDVIRSTRETGCSHLLLFNNLPIGCCETVIFSECDTIGIRICDPESLPKYDLSPLHQDELAELLPASICLGSIPFDLGKASALRTGSFINLDTSGKAAENASLMAGGIEIARGTVIWVDDVMGIRVASVTKTYPRGNSFRTGTSVADTETALRAKPFDFGIPDFLSEIQLKSLERIHASVARSLVLAFGASENSGIGTVCQCTQQRWSEALSQFEIHCLAPAFSAELSGRPDNPAGAEFRDNQLIVYEAPSCARPLGKEMKDYLQRAYGQHGAMTRRPVFIFAPKDGKLQSLLGSASERAKFLSAIGSGWKNTIDFRLTELSAKSPGMDYPAYEMVLAITLGAKGEKPIAGIVYPVQTLEPYLRILGR